jgi:hypothetical protein
VEAERQRIRVEDHRTEANAGHSFFCLYVILLIESLLLLPYAKYVLFSYQFMTKRDHLNYIGHN